MRGVFLAGLIMAAALTHSATAAAEHYVKVPQLVVRFATPTAYLRLLVVKVDVAVASPEDALLARADQARIRQTLRDALAGVSFDDYAKGNLASRVKSVGRTAIRRAKLNYIGDILVQEARLM